MKNLSVPVLLLTLAATPLCLPASSQAAELYAVTLPDTVTVGDETLTLNGMGLRKKAFIKVYVAGLYLPAKAADADAILAGDRPRRMEMIFKFGVSAEKMCDAWKEGLDKNTPSPSATVRAHFETLCSYMDDLDKGDSMIATYIPGTGTEIEVKGTSKGTLEGKEFADALFACWIGPEPPSEDFKSGLLGR